MAQQNRKVIKYKRKPKAALIIFTVVLLYIVCFILIYISKSKVNTYEVNEGALTSNASFTGVALRDETLYNSSYSGNIAYYQREGTRAKIGDTIYTVDETGKVSDILSQYTKDGENSLSDESLKSIKSYLNSFKTSYDGSNFSDIYDVKTEINTTILDSVNANIMNNLDSIIEKTGSEVFFRNIKCEESGIVVYNYDNLENLKPEDLNPGIFDKSKYEKHILKNEQLVVANNPVYKVINNETWSIAIPLTKNEITEYNLESKNSISVRIKKDDIVTSGSFKIINNNTNYYGIVTLNKYMIRYATERFIDIELMTAEKNGLKIPVSCITENDFYMIPKDYLTKGGNGNSSGFICQNYDTSSQTETRFVEVDIYKTDDDYVYVNKRSLQTGTSLIMPQSDSHYVVGPTCRLKGVYCVNTGYTAFKLVDVIDSNNEYCIVKKNISHGISVYDRILIDADKYEDNVMVY